MRCSRASITAPCARCVCSHTPTVGPSATSGCSEDFAPRVWFIGPLQPPPPGRCCRWTAHWLMCPLLYSERENQTLISNRATRWSKVFLARWAEPVSCGHVPLVCSDSFFLANVFYATIFFSRLFFSASIGPNSPQARFLCQLFSVFSLDFRDISNQPGAYLYVNASGALERGVCMQGDYLQAY